MLLNYCLEAAGWDTRNIQQMEEISYKSESRNYRKHPCNVCGEYRNSGIMGHNGGFAMGTGRLHEIHPNIPMHVFVENST